MRKTLLVLSLLVAPALLAQTADLEIIRFNLSATLTETGQRFALDVAWRNNGPNPARFVNVKVTGTPVPFYVQSVAKTGWPCYPTPDGTSFSCQNLQLDPGAEAELVLQMLTPPVAGPFTLRANIFAEQTDPNPANNTRETTATIAAGPVVDLAVSPTAQTQLATAGAQVTMPLNIANNSSTAVDQVFLYLSVPVSFDIPVFSAQGAGWTCSGLPYGPQAVICTRPRLNAGENAPITVTTTAPATDGSFTITGRLRGQGHSDPFGGNDLATLTVQVGSSEEPPPPVDEWHAVLIPLIGPDAPGLNGSLWRTEVTALVSADASPDVRLCGLSPACGTVPLPVRVPFNVQQTLPQYFSGGLGHIIYVRPADEPNLHINSRVYDVSRSEQTAGAEIPIVREREFRSTRVSLVGIPVAPQYRHTLRVYALDAQGSEPVRVSVYAGDETTPRATNVFPLFVGEQVLTPMRPATPGVIQLDLQQFVNLTGVETIRVDVEPVNAGLRLWSFVSVTNNDTHHVTTFTQN
jgi:hypothetical protein